MSLLTNIGVAVALITAISSMIIAIINNRNLKAIELKKQKHELLTYRYIKLYETLEKIHSLPKPIAPLDGNLTREFILEQSDLDCTLSNLYRTIKPLLSLDNRNEVESSYNKKVGFNIEFRELIGADLESLDRLQITTLIKAKTVLDIEFEKELGLAISKQLSQLLDTNANNK